MNALTDAARAEADRRWGYGSLKPNSEMEASDWLDEGMSSGFVLGAQWQAEQEPTEAQVREAGIGIASVVHHEDPDLIRITFDVLDRDGYYSAQARAALRAAYATGGAA